MAIHRKTYTDKNIYEVYCYGWNRNQLGFDSRYYYQRLTLSNLSHQQINGFVSTAKWKDSVRIHRQENSLLQNQKGGCYYISWKEKSISRILFRTGRLVQGELYRQNERRSTRTDSWKDEAVLHGTFCAISWCADCDRNIKSNRLRYNVNKWLVQERTS